MSVIIILLIVSISVAALFLAGFIWSVKTGQYDDEYSPPRRMLFDDPAPGQEAGSSKDPQPHP
ncbi:MAG: cbb3-type cytochrome oxidase assembly protein CcoS [Candidatus Pseudobacter hemicellulosilyticus]|uniref:Cbb3-type cytochrome oxidase assembly protein CcoS n=1 Tax=Candidatus Pseudobacter hemicellulosilyticus TaxID=3121375 RepID=A0AAJ5WPW9_9BACT|nr:MAG: cbb3-type cytochrome oxidase assembly protein CcoS [Pseudobacter sp.]